jgi:hypothetical protein
MYASCLRKDIRLIQCVLKVDTKLSELEMLFELCNSHTPYVERGAYQTGGLTTFTLQIVVLLLFAVWYKA